MDYYIRIVGKVKHNKDVLWYYDENGFRYSEEDICVILRNDCRDVNKMMYLRERLLIDGNIQNLKINMRMSGNKLVSSRGRLQSIDVFNRVLYVVCEDSSSGYTLYQRLLEFMYPNIVFKFTTSKGNSNLGATVEKLLSKHRGEVDLILIADYKRESAAFRRNINKLKIIADGERTRLKIWLFRPTCVEEIILSNKNLPCRQSKLASLIQSYNKSGRLYYTVNIRTDDIVENYVLMGGVEVANLEALLANELSKVSYFRYKKSQLSSCFVTYCCPKYIGDRQLRCKLYAASLRGCKSFMDEESLASGLQNIVDNILHKDIKWLHNWSKESIDNLYRRL